MLTQELIKEKLKEGQVIFDYPTLCKILNTPKHNKTSTQGKAFLKELKRFVNFKNSGKKFVILDIYDTPLEKDDKRKKGNNSVYVNYIEAILLYHLSQTNDDVSYFTQRRLINILGLANPDYKNVSLPQLTKENIVVNQWELDDFNRRSWFKLSRIIESALKNLESRSLINVENEYIIVKEDGTRFKAVDDDIRNILQVENYVIEKNEYTNKGLIALTGKNKQFYSEVNNILQDKYKWKYYYKQRKIISISNDALQRGMERNLIEMQKLMLNEKVIDAINHDAESKALNIKENFKYPSYYLNHQQLLTQRFININEEARNSYIENELLDQELEMLFY